MIKKHLAYFLTLELVGFMVGIIMAIIVIRYSKKFGIFSREAKGSFSRFLNKAYKPIMFLSVLSLVLTIFTHIAVKGIVKKEIKHGVTNSLAYLEENHLQSESIRKQMYEVGKKVLSGGGYLNSFNEAFAKSTSEFASKDTNDGFLVSKFKSLWMSNKIKKDLTELEKGIVFYLSSKAFEQMGVKVGEYYNYETYEKDFNQWLKSDFKDASIDINIMISDLIYKNIKPVISSIFLPFFIIGIICLLIPFIHFAFYKSQKSKIG